MLLKNTHKKTLTIVTEKNTDLAEFLNGKSAPRDRYNENIPLAF
jgi:hypothetical protein